MKEFIVDRQPWRRWPRVLVVRKIDGTPNIEERRYVPERTTTRDTTHTVYGNERPVCEVCGFGIEDSRWGYCPKCGARIIWRGQMSMISSQCDKLRRTADEIERIKSNNADWLWRDAVTLTDAMEQMREAADLILELRNDLQQANSENAKLRELVRDIWNVYHEGATNGEFRALPDRLRELGVD